MSSQQPPSPVSVTHGAHPDDERFRAPVEAEALARGLAARSPSRLGAALRITERVNRATALVDSLDALVVGVSDALVADTAAVMLLEDSIDGPVLVMYASRGRATPGASPLRIP